MGDTDKTSSSGRWWEYYFIRYFFGTVIGAALVALFGESIEPLKKLIPSLLSDPHTGGAKDFTILASCGLAYCYVASAPMLVLHTMRVELFAIFGASKPLNKSESRLSVDFSNFLWLPSIGLILFSISIIGYVAYRGWSTSHIGIICLVFIVLGQLGLIIGAHLNKFTAIRQFYKNLSRARTAPAARDYIESYRHLREHSNAYSIIILEFILAPAVMAAKEPWTLTLVALVWLGPAGYCWLIASLLEAEFANSFDSEPTKQLGTLD